MLTAADEFETCAVRQNNGNMKGEMMRGKSENMICLSGAEMDYPTAPCIRRALAEFAGNGLYGFTLKDRSYIQAIQWWMKNVRETDADESWVVPTMGTVFGACTAIRAFTQPGDGVLIQSPSYYRFDRAILRNGRKVVYNPMREIDGHYQLNFADLERKMSDPRNKMMILVNPHNPTGRVFPREDLQKISQLAGNYGVIIFSDEIFAETAQEGYRTVPYVSVDPENGITSFSLGKSFNFTGVNQANLLIPDPVLRERYIRQRNIDHFGSIDPFFYTAMRSAYTKEGLSWVNRMNRHTRDQYQRIKETFRNEIPLLSLSPLEGTFVAWIDCRKLRLTDEALQNFMEQEAMILADPGVEYGAMGSGFYRWNIATSEENIQKALGGLKKACDRRMRKTAI